MSVLSWINAGRSHWRPTTRPHSHVAHMDGRHGSRHLAHLRWTAFPRVAAVSTTASPSHWMATPVAAAFSCRGSPYGFCGTIQCTVAKPLTARDSWAVAHLPAKLTASTTPPQRAFLHRPPLPVETAPSLTSQAPPSPNTRPRKQPLHSTVPYPFPPLQSASPIRPPDTVYLRPLRSRYRASQRPPRSLHASAAGPPL